MTPHCRSAFEPGRPDDPAREAAGFDHLHDNSVLRDAVQLFEFGDGGDTLRPYDCLPYPEHAVDNELAKLQGSALTATRSVRADTPTRRHAVRDPAWHSAGQPALRNR